jgi:hypothetical protein
MVATLIFTLTFAGAITVFFQGIDLAEMSRNSSTAVLAAKNQIAAIENTPFAQITAAYNNATFTAANVTGIGIIYVTNPSADIAQVTLTFCWRQKNGRIIGEDANLNGQMNAGEDKNGNGILDSPVKLTTTIYDTSGIS